MVAEVVKFPVSNIADIPAGLRALADQIEAGEHGEAYNLAYVLDEGDGNLSMGMLGQSESPGTVAYFLYGLAQRKLEKV